jgi:hypothetical protein
MLDYHSHKENKFNKMLWLAIDLHKNLIIIVYININNVPNMIDYAKICALSFLYISRNISMIKSWYKFAFKIQSPQFKKKS